MPFPDPHDIKLMRDAGKLVADSEKLSDWVGQFGPRRVRGVKAISPDSQFELLQLRRKARALYASARVPVAVGVYGLSQVGKSLLIGSVLDPERAGDATLGRDEHVGDGRFERVSFREDLNPRTIDFEATALVTRLTTKDRMPTAGAASPLPVMVRALNRSQWLAVLGRGFQMECAEGDAVWTPSSFEELLDQLSKEFPATRVDPAWRSDLLDAYTELLVERKHLLKLTETQFFGLLSRYPLNDTGYVRLAARLFWDNWSQLTTLFERVAKFLASIAQHNHTTDEVLNDSYLHCDWRAVRFLLDSQRTPTYASPNLGENRWDEFRIVRGERALELRPSADGEKVDLGTIQAGMLEMVIPVLPERLTENWRRVLQSVDLLDLPGARPGRTASGGKRRADEVLEEADLQQIVKRGKVAYLFERYSADKQIHTLLMLVRGGNLNDGGTLRDHVNRWGLSRYENRWFAQVPSGETPSLFLGLTGFDQPFRHLADPVESSLFDARLSELRNALNPLMDNFGGDGRPFQNIYLIRYPGSWDANAESRRREGEAKWDKAYEAFLKSRQVQTYVEDAPLKVERAKLDQDGGLSLLSERFAQVTQADGKQEELRAHINDSRLRLAALAESWYVAKDIGVKRRERRELAEKVLAWLDSSHAMYRVHALIDSLSLQDGDSTWLADLADPTSLHDVVSAKDSREQLGERLREFLRFWSLELAPKRWKRHLDQCRKQLANQFEKLHDTQKLTEADFGKLAAFLKDYLCMAEPYASLCDALLPIVELRLTDKMSLQQNARRRYVRMVLNDYLLNPGPNPSPLESDSRPAQVSWGLAAEFVHRWRTRLPVVLGVGGRDEEIPPGNDELGGLLPSR